MTTLTNPPFVMMLIAIASLACTIFVTVRAKHWRDTDEGKTLLTKIKTDHTALANRVDETEDRLTKIETRLENMPTKADLASVQSDVRSIMRELGGVDAGVKRIEQFMMDRS